MNRKMIQRHENVYFSKTKRETVQQHIHKKLWQLQENSRVKNHEKSYREVKNFEVLRKAEMLYCDIDKPVLTHAMHATIQQI